MVRQGSGWVMEGGDGYTSYSGTPTSNGFPTPGPTSAFVNSPGFSAVPPTPSSVPIPPTPQS
ncbi:hypothetical protein H0H93_005469, partial [Arthromyces matolae]